MFLSENVSKGDSSLKDKDRAASAITGIITNWFKLFQNLNPCLLRNSEKGETQNIPFCLVEFVCELEMLSDLYNH